MAIVLEGDDVDPLFGMSTGLIVKKDISCGGFVSANQGLVALGSGMTNQFDPAGAWLFHSGYMALHDVEQLPSAPSSDLVDGRLYINSGNRHLYKYYGGAWYDMGHINNYQYYFDTFYIRVSGYEVVFPVWASSAPNPAVSKFWVNTGNSHLYRYNGSTLG